MSPRHLLAAAAAAAAFAAALILQAMWGPLEPATDVRRPQLPISLAYARQAERALAGPEGWRPPHPALAVAERATREELALSPFHTEAWLRLAYIERLRHGRITPAAAAALARSYEAGPLDADVTAWRLRFCLEHWSQLTPALREAAITELSAASHRVPAGRALPRPENIADPTGRMALALILKDPGS